MEISSYDDTDIIKWRPSWDVYNQPYIFSPIAWSLVYPGESIFDIWTFNFYIYES